MISVVDDVLKCGMVTVYKGTISSVYRLYALNAKCIDTNIYDSDRSWDGNVVDEEIYVRTNNTYTTSALVEIDCIPFLEFEKLLEKSQTEFL